MRYGLATFLFAIFLFIFFAPVIFAHKELSYVRPAEQPKSAPLVHRVSAIVSAYTASAAETDDTPTITASGEAVRVGVAANNCLAFGTRVEIRGKEYVIFDRMNSRYDCKHFDVYVEERSEALSFGRQHIPVIVKK